MKLTIKAQSCEQLPDGTYMLMTNVESLKEALSMHSPNILIDYLNECHRPTIAHVNYKKRKDGSHGNV